LKIIAVACLLLILVACGGCASLVKEPGVKVESTNLIGVDTSGVDLELFLAVENPNSFDLSLLGYTFDLQVMTLPLTAGGSQVKVALPAGKLSHMRLPMRMKYTDIIEVIKRRPDLAKIPYQVTARLNVETPVGELIVPVNKTDTISIPEQYRPAGYLKRILQPLKDLR
jgi:LEA14-like dessication related protein